MAGRVKNQAETTEPAPGPGESHVAVDAADLTDRARDALRELARALGRLAARDMLASRVASDGTATGASKETSANSDESEAP